MEHKRDFQDAQSSDLPALLHAEHERVMQAVRELRSMLASEAPSDRFPQWRLGLLQRLRHLIADLLTHFDLEEESGFMSQTLLRAPQKDRIVQRLRQEHSEIVRQLNSVVTDAEAVSHRSDWGSKEIPQRTVAVFSLLQDHESAEGALIQETYLQDEGGPD